ncbi:MAG: hypothetical protein R3E88_01220 [Myxococcota bacterium]
MALVALLAPPALATRVTDVRVGRHPTFTRIVFELDGPTGYKLDRTDSGGAAELVVTLNASGKDQKLALPKSLVDRVDVRSEGRSTVARIRLARSGLGLKELMLNSPSRIVLDVLEDAPAPAVAKSAPKPSPTKTAAAPKPAPVAKAEKTEKITAPAAVAKPAPAPRVAPEPAPAPTAARAIPAASSPASPSPAGGARAVPEDAAGEPIEFETAEEPVAPRAGAIPAAADASPPPAAGDEPVRIAMATPDAPTPAQAASAPRTSLPPATTRSAAPVPGPDDSSFLGTGAIALAGVALLVAGGAVIALRRRRAGELDDGDDDGEIGDEFGDDNPFAGLESAAPTEEAGEPATLGGAVDDDSQTDLFAGTPTAAEQDDDDAPAPRTGAAHAAKPPHKASGGEGSNMSMDGTLDFGADPNAATAIPSMGGVDTDAIMRLIRNLESRVSDLETRLEEAVDAKERLERQVAAQTEELRVQRAAIARTQRAVRNLSQPVEDTPTEPALREPTPE